MKLRPTLTTTTDPALLEQVQAIQSDEKRTRASVVEELLTLGLKSRARQIRSHRAPKVQSASSVSRRRA